MINVFFSQIKHMVGRYAKYCYHSQKQCGFVAQEKLTAARIFFFRHDVVKLEYLKQFNSLLNSIRWKLNVFSPCGVVASMKRSVECHHFRLLFASGSSVLHTTKQPTENTEGTCGFIIPFDSAAFLPPALAYKRPGESYIMHVIKKTKLSLNVLHVVVAVLSNLE